MATATQARTEFQSSELSRNAAEVFAAAERKPVTITRRDSDALVLVNAAEAAARRKLLEFAAQLIAVTTDDRGTLAERMAAQFPWMLALPEADQAQCAADLVRAARASFATEQAHLAIAELHSWRETAAAIATGLRPASADWLDTPEPVARP